MSIHRVEDQPSLFPIPPRMPAFRRCHCACGCGRWWYSPRTPGRPPKYATPECYRKARNERDRGNGWRNDARDLRRADGQGVG